jgi:hypothetical protein
MELDADQERAECHTSAGEMDVARVPYILIASSGVDASVGYRRQGGRDNGEAMAFQRRPVTRIVTVGWGCGRRWGAIAVAIGTFQPRITLATGGLIPLTAD